MVFAIIMFAELLTLQLENGYTVGLAFKVAVPIAFVDSPFVYNTPFAITLPAVLGLSSKVTWYGGNTYAAIDRDEDLLVVTDAV